MYRLGFVVVLIGLIAAVDTGRGAEAHLDARLTGYPTVIMRIHGDRIETPAHIAAGRTLVVQENHTSKDAHFFIYRIPDDVSDADAAASLAAPETPAWFFRGVFAGNPDRSAPDGGRTYALVDLEPGRYQVIHPLDPAIAPGRFTVTGERPDVEDLEPIEADVVADMREMAFEMPDSVQAGSRLWQVVNTGAAPHEIAITRVPAGATSEQVVAAFTALFAGQAPPADLGPAWAEWQAPLVNGVGVTSPGGTVWAQFDLAPGTYAAVCFFPGQDNVPHLMVGMVEIFTVTST